MFLVFLRAGAVVSLLPGFGERMVPGRVRLGAAIAFAVLTWPLVQGRLPSALPPPAAMGLAFLAEAANGLLLGIGFRLVVMVLQLAGSVAAQSTSLAQIFGAGATPDPLPAIGNILVIAGLAVAMAAGLHVRAVQALSLSYDILPAGRFAAAADVAAWGTSRVAGAFALAVTLAAPFVLASLAYNVALGAINRAMPQLMVAFIGAPAITAGGIVLLMLSAPVVLDVWRGTLDAALSAPLGPVP
ncbi:MAG: flagellar biosynthetic protein FliR [Paracoccaceae bacterium]